MSRSLFRVALLAVGLSSTFLACAGIEPFWLDHWKGAQDERLPAQVPSALSFVSYNVFLRPAAISFGDETECRATEIARQLSSRGADVVALQETWTTSEVIDLAHTAGEALPYRVLSKPARGSSAITGGLSLLSRWPLEDVTTEVYDDCSGIDCLSAKGILHAVVRIAEDARVHVVTTHLNAGSDADAAETRRAQLEQLGAFVDRLDPKVGPIVLLGDFNVDALKSQAEYRALLDKLAVADGPETPASTMNCNTDVTCDGTGPGKHLDYVFTRASERRLVRGATRTEPMQVPTGICDSEARWLSDHRLVQTSFETRFPG